MVGASDIALACMQVEGSSALHDIILAIIRAANFLQGRYNLHETFSLLVAFAALHGEMLTGLSYTVKFQPSTDHSTEHLLFSAKP